MVKLLRTALALALLLGALPAHAQDPPLGPTLKVTQGATSCSNTKVLAISSGATATYAGTTCTLAISGAGGDVTDVTATSPIVSSGGTAPDRGRDPRRRQDVRRR